MRKILITSITLLMLICFYLIPDSDKNFTGNMKVEFVSNMGSNSIYLLNKDNYLVKSNILLTEKTKEDKIKKVIEKLKNSNNNISNKLRGIIPSKTKLLSVKIDEKSAILDFSKDILDVSLDIEGRMLEAIVFSLTDIDGIDSVVINVEGNLMSEYPNSKEKISYPLNRDMGINKKYDISSRNNINKVVIYYVEKINDVNYYVPVTKYLNDDREKIKIIVDELASSYIYEPNLMSFLNSKTELLSYNVDNGVLFLDFNDQLYGSNNKILEEVIYTLGYSIFENYDVNSFVFSVNGDSIRTISEKNLVSGSINK